MKPSPEFRSFQLCVKRALDIITPVAVLIVVSPLLLLVALLIKIESPGPIFSSEIQYDYRIYQFQVLKISLRNRRTAADAGRPTPASKWT